MAEFAFGQVPVLEVEGGVRINQSRVICAYVAKQLGTLHCIGFFSTHLISD